MLYVLFTGWSSEFELMILRCLEKVPFPSAPWQFSGSSFACELSRRNNHRNGLTFLVSLGMTKVIHLYQKSSAIFRANLVLGSACGWRESVLALNSSDTIHGLDMSACLFFDLQVECSANSEFDRVTQLCNFATVPAADGSSPSLRWLDCP